MPPLAFVVSVVAEVVGASIGSALGQWWPGPSVGPRSTSVLVFPMRLIRILPLMVCLSPAFADVGDVYIPQCDREHERCIRRSFTASATAQCEKTREACRTATINEAIRNSGMSASELFDMRSLRRTDEHEAARQ